MTIALISIAVLVGFPTKITTNLDVGSQTALFWVFIALIVLLTFLNLGVLLDWLPWKKHTLNRTAAVYALFVWPFLMLMKDLTRPIYSFSLISLLFVAIGIGNSETALVMMLGGLAVLAFYKAFNFAKPIGASLLAVGMVAIMIIPPTLAYLYLTAVTRPYEYLIGKTVHHLQVWSESLKEVIDHMNFGGGINISRFFRDIPESVSYGFKIHHPHNITLEMLLDFGLFGIIVLTVIVYAGIRVFQLSEAQNRPMVAATIIALILLYSLAFSVWQEWRTGFVAFAIVILRHQLIAKVKAYA